MKTAKHIYFFIAALAVLQACETPEPAPYTAAAKYCLDEQFKENLTYETAVVQPVTEGIHLTGAVEANPDKVVKFVSLVEGVISHVGFSLGQEVLEGQVLAELHSPELSSLESELKTLTSQIKVAKKNKKAVQSMYDDGISSKKDLQEAKSELTIYQAEREKVRANLKLYSASSEKGVFQIKAPTSGIVTSKSISPGTQITADDDVLFTISDLSEVWIMADIYTTNVQNIEVGMNVNITNLSYPDTIFKGKIQAISQLLDTDAKVLKARIAIPNPDLKLKPGMWVDVVALKDKNQEAVSLPTEAVVFDENKNFVIVYNGDCDLEIREIEIISRNNGEVFISSGVNENEMVISQNQLLIYEQIRNE